MAEVDIAAVFQLLGSVAADVREMRAELRGKADKSEVAEVRAGIASMRQTLTEYHSSVLGHGVMISDLEGRVRRIERHLNLPPHAAE